MLHYWQFFLALESDFAETARYVEPVTANMLCHSIEFAQLLLRAGSEVDVLCKVLCQAHGLSPSPKNIDGYRVSIMSRFPNFTKLEVRLPRYNLLRLPWQPWERHETPEWWRAYNRIKHERDRSFSDANLANTLDAMAGLFVLVCYVCQKELSGRTAQPWPEMLTLDPMLSADIRTNLRPGHVLPDFR